MKTFSGMVGGVLLVTVVSLIGSISSQAQLPTSALLDTNTVLAETLLLPPLNLPLVEPSEVSESGSFYSLQRTDYPPLPFCPIPWLPVYLLETNASGSPWFGYDDRAVDYEAVDAQRLAARLAEAAALGISLEEMELLESGGPYAAYSYSPNDLWLEITAFTNHTAAFVIHAPSGDTNLFHDLYYTDSLTPPVQWQFAMRCPYTNAVVTDLCPPQGFFRLGPATNGDLTVSNNVTAQELADLLVPPGVTVTNANYTGTNVARGSFMGGNGCGLPLESGVILSTGYITNALGPDNDSGYIASYVTQISDLGQTNDLDLEKLLGTNAPPRTYDAAVLEFDVFWTNAFTLGFQYIFASEEYPEFIGAYNDPMAIFVSTNRVGTNWVNDPTNNIAWVPGTINLPVTVNTINGGCVSNAYFDFAAPTNAQYYVDNHDPGPDTSFAVPPYEVAASVFNIQYDGMTVLLTAQIQVSANVTNHVKIAIEDYGDAKYDSAVFIKPWLPYQSP